jgi:tetratricopeptide (TPR) repeat protein
MADSGITEAPLFVEDLRGHRLQRSFVCVGHGPLTSSNTRSTNLATALEATPVIEDALRIRRSLGQQREIAISLLQLGELYSAQGDLPASEQHYRECLALRASADRQTIGLALDGVAKVALLRGELEAAQAAFGEAADAHSGAGFSHGQAMALRARARCLRGLGRRDEAHAVMVSALALLQSVGDSAADEMQQELEEFGAGFQ